jgi:peptidoglycan/LPS O-acetylase OafA/YrhL
VAGVNSAGPSHYRADIDGLRAIAVLSVVGFHAFPHRLRGGFTGVDVFFVISGFLISGLILEDLARGRFSFRRFYARRFRRIFPALVVVLAASLLYGAVALAPDAFRELGKQAAAAAVFSSNLLLERSRVGYFNPNEASNPLLHLWSLGVEEQFYIAWPIVLVLTAGRARGFLLACAVLLLASFALNIALTQGDSRAAFYWPMPRFWELLLGSLLAYAARDGAAAGAVPDAAQHRQAQWRAVIGVGLIGAGLALIDPARAFPGWWALLPTVGTALVISAPHAWINRTLLSAKPLVFIGLISYPLYLWHWVLLSFAGIANFDEELPLAGRLAAVAASGVLAWLTYRCVEKPIRFSGHRDAIPRALVACMAVCGLAGCVIYATDGFAFRYPRQMRELAAYDHDEEVEFYEQAYRGGVCFLGATDSFAAVASRCVDHPHPASGSEAASVPAAPKVPHAAAAPDSASPRDALAGPAAPSGPDAASKLVVLWGDSHAASLYPGLRAAQQQGGFRIAQFTASSCPPVLGLSSDRRPHCKDFNDFVIAQLRALRPDVVIMGGHWAIYSATMGWPDFDAAGLRRTVETVERIGIPTIIVMGSLPTWKIYEPRVALDLWRHGHEFKDRSNALLDPAAFAADAFARHAVAGTGAIFVSPIATLCDAEGCMISSDPHTPTPLAWDHDHLSLAGSRLVVKLALEPLLGERPRT